jgi:argininosuccinate lyase
LVKQGVAFRDAHEITGELVRFCETEGLELELLTDAQLAKVSKHLKPEVKKVLSVSGSIEARNGAGGTASSQVIGQLVQLRNLTKRGKM